MKIRQGFVANSSSSSFIIAERTNREVCPTCGRSDFSFLDVVAVSRDSWCETSLVERGVDAVLRYLESDLSYYKTPPDCIVEEIELVKKYIGDDKWEVALIKLSYHDLGMHDMLNAFVEAGIIREIGER